MEDRKFFNLLKDEIRIWGIELCVPDDEIIALVLSQCELLTFPKNYRIMEEGKTYTSLYIVKSGLLRLSYYEEDREFTIGISGAPTATISPLGFVMNKTSHYMVTSCTRVEVYELKKKKFDRLVMEHPSFSRWMLGISLCQMASFEFKTQHLIGSSKDKYKSLMKKEYVKKRYTSFINKFPDLIVELNDRIIASYLGVNHTYLSMIKHELVEEERQKNRDTSTDKEKKSKN